MRELYTGPLLHLVLNFRPPTIKISGLSRLNTTAASIHDTHYTRALSEDDLEG